MNSLSTILRRRGRFGFTLIELSIVVLIVGILAAMALPAYMRIRESSKAKVCRTHLRHIQDAKERWALDNRKSNTDEPTMEQLIPNYLKETPECPCSGEYDIGAVGDNPTCSYEGHTLN